MKSPLDVRLGAELPQIIREPPDIASRDTARDTIELANRYQISDGNPLSPSQELRILNGMAERSDGSWAAKRVGDFGGRQGAGKSSTAIARILGGIFLVGEQLIIYTAHEYPTANEIYIRIGQIFESWDDFAGLVTHERKSHGDQGYDLKGPKGHERTGKRRLLFKTRTGKSGRGFAKADLILYDEAQHLQPEHIAGSGPAKLANPNSQSWWSGSGGLAISGPAWEMRRQAILGTGGRLSYTEHTAETYTVTSDGKIVWVAPSATDRNAWYAANPGLGRWVAEEDFADLVIELGELAPRELLCVWEPEAGANEQVIAADIWAACEQPTSKIVSHDNWSIAISDDRRWASFGIAGRNADGVSHIECIDRRTNGDWVFEVAAKIWHQKRIPVRIHKGTAEHGIVPRLREMGIEVVEVPSSEVAIATGQLIDEANAGRLAHLGGPWLNKAIKGAELRTSPEGASLWSQRSSVEITPLRAVTVALGGVPQEAVFAGSYFVDLDDFDDD